MPGPRPTPTSKLSLRGSWRAKARKNEPEPVGEITAPPKWLDCHAKKVWKELVPQLAAMNVGRVIDENALARYCSTWVRWKKAEEIVRKEGESYPLLSAKGEIKCLMPRPEATLLNKLSVLLLRLEQEFGMTPSARARINVDVSKPPAPAKPKLSKIVG
jgi:P27 family predicted phage terminase small subunit